MSKAQQQQSQEENEMQEILESIRRIIAEDDDGNPVEAAEAEEAPAEEQAAAEETPEEEPQAEEETDDDVLELTEIIDEEEPEVEEAAAEEEPEEAADDILSNIDAALTQEEPEQAPTSTADDDSLLSQPTAEKASSLLKDLKSNTKKEIMPETNLPSTRNGTSVEDLMIEAMRPMLKEWLDDNLPTIVERIVEREVRKLSD